MKAFWSWQSDLPRREGHYFVRDAIAEALGRVAVDLQLEERPDVDHDTKDVAGLAPITDVIFQKIESSAVFIADVTPVACTADGKYVPNPNVMIELGFALRALEWRRIILIWNAAHPGCTPENLPFDLRHRRAPIGYELPEGAPAFEAGAQRAQLTASLAEALKMSFRAIIAEAPKPSAPSFNPVPLPSAARGAWANDDSVQRVTSRSNHEDLIHLGDGPRIYLRIVPTSPPDLNLDRLDDGTPLLPLLGEPSLLHWGPTTGGFLCFAPDVKAVGLLVASVATKYFRRTGEIWAVGLAAREYRGKLIASPSRIGALWARTLQRSISIYEERGVVGPYLLIAGAVGLEETVVSWERRALEDSIHVERIIDGGEVKAVSLELWNEIRAAYGLGPQTASDMDTQRQKIRI